MIKNGQAVIDDVPICNPSFKINEQVIGKNLAINFPQVNKTARLIPQT